MPQAPNVEGLPLWLQITITLLFGLATLGVMMLGYFQRAHPKGGEVNEQARIISASFADMGAIRHLSDVCIQLCGNIERLEEAVREQTHHDRNRNDLLTETARRLREVIERLDRLPGR